MKSLMSRPLVPTTILLAAIVLVVVWTAPLRKAQEVWRENEKVIQDAAMGKRVNLSEFRESVDFFYRLTGITIPSEHYTIVDHVPNKETGTALEPLRRWYATNNYRLYWDEEREEVRLAFAGD